MTIDIVNSFGFCTNLPKDYMNFMTTVNGGIPNKNTISIETSGYKNTTSIDRFLGVTAKYDCNILSYLNAYKEYDGIIPDYMLQIAVDISGDAIFLALKTNDKRGKVYYWDHDYIFHSDKFYNPNEPILIADSFDEFLGRVKYFV